MNIVILALTRRYTSPKHADGDSARCLCPHRSRIEEGAHREGPGTAILGALKERDLALEYRERGAGNHDNDEASTD